MVESVLISISLIIGIAALFAILARLIKQPPIIAYLIAGILVGPLFFNIVNPNTESSLFLQVFARMGIALLLFIVGLSLDFRVLKEFGKVATLAGIGEVVTTSTFGFLISLFLGFKFIPALYLAAALSFSSTVVVVKLLSDKKEMNTLHGRIALGILIVEDFIAAIVLMLLPVLQTGNISLISIGISKIILLGVFVFLVYNLLISKFVYFLARNQETLFLSGLAWALILASLFNYLGLSLEIGALIAGMSLASTKYTLELSGKIKPLRDFFVVLLFVFFGSQLIGPISKEIIKYAIIYSALILVGKPLIVMSFMRMFGYKKRTTFLTGASLAQLSEFSLIIILLGFTLGFLNQELMNLAVLVSLITIGISSYSIHYSSLIFNKISHLLNIFDGKTSEESLTKREHEVYDIVLLGYHRIGYKILDLLNKSKAKVLVIDYNPKVILSLAKSDVNCIYGDASDKEFLNEINLGRVKLIISTIPNEDANIIIKRYLEESGSKATLVATAEQPRQALDLYSEGIDYVIIPHHLGGDYLAGMINSFWLDKEKYIKAGKNHKKYLLKAKNNSSFM